MDRINKLTLLGAVILAFYCFIKETFATFGKKVVGFHHYLLTDALKLPPVDIFLSRETISLTASQMRTFYFTTDL